jgi:heme oxygenase
MTSNLATQLREGTSKSHSMAENVSFVKSFLGGVIYLFSNAVKSNP